MNEEFKEAQKIKRTIYRSPLPKKKPRILIRPKKFYGEVKVFTEEEKRKLNETYFNIMDAGSNP